MGLRRARASAGRSAQTERVLMAVDYVAILQQRAIAAQARTTRSARTCTTWPISSTGVA